jgi:hypothetical protein
MTSGTEPVNAPAPTRNGTAPATEAAPALRVIPMDELLSLLDLRQPERYAVEVPEWGAIFYVRGLSRNESLQFVKLSTNAKTNVMDSAKADQLQFCRGVLEPRVSAEQYQLLCERHPPAHPEPDRGPDQRRAGRGRRRPGGRRGHRRRVSIWRHIPMKSSTAPSPLSCT